jgi:hypothetical protein
MAARQRVGQAARTIASPFSTWRVRFSVRLPDQESNTLPGPERRYPSWRILPCRLVTPTRKPSTCGYFFGFRPVRTTELWPTESGPTECEGSAPLSHSGSGTCVSLFDPAPAPGRQWLRHLCPAGSTTGPVLIFSGDIGLWHTLNVMKADGTDQRRLTRTFGQFAVRSPDGQCILSAPWLNVIRPDGTGLTRMPVEATPAESEMPDWVGA